ncbi:heat shock protein Hsp20 [Blastocladiella britannica]|nr:heat shock protein Hsp20 [Blastocladiella britannica]
MSLSTFRAVPSSDLFAIDRPLRQMLNEVDRAMSTLYRGGGGVGQPSSLLESGFIPRVDVQETDKMFEIKCDVPGIPKESIHLECRDNGLLISGQTKKEEEKDEGTMHIRERFEGSFQRLIPMPPTANFDQAKASFSDGVLQVAIPKTQSASAKRITIE